MINHVSFRKFTVYSIALRISIHTFKCRQCNSLFKSFYLACCGVGSTLKQHASHVRPSGQLCVLQEAQLSPSDRAMRRVSRNLANYHTTVQKLLVQQVLNKPNCLHYPDHAHLGNTHSSQDFAWPTRVQNLKSPALAIVEILHGV